MLRWARDRTVVKAATPWPPHCPGTPGTGRAPHHFLAWSLRRRLHYPAAESGVLWEEARDTHLERLADEPPRVT
ncbi:hypothetical protein ACF1GT_00380 [Streptomyces sp. NPDC014636]|uniref:hypothetical protein n=1 Tax=Streptomyces sp. NPDC014636 TaxID=3364876 RepID=UPI0036FE6D16